MTPDTFVIYIVPAILFAATLVHVALGFGTALVAMPLLVLVLGLHVATPLVAMVVLITISLILVREWRHVNLKAATQLLTASLFGIPVGLLMLHAVPVSFVKGVLGATLVSYSIYCLARPKLPTITSPWLVFILGFVAGVLGGAYNTNGPPIVLFGALSQWSPEKFRATIQGYSLPVAIMVCMGHGAAGLWTPYVFLLLAFSVPAVLIANFIGVPLARGFPAERFTHLLYKVLVILGILMFF